MLKRVRSLYGGADWLEVTGSTVNELQTAWQDHLRPFRDDQRLSLLSNALYQDPGTLGALCPHSKVDLKRPRSAGLYGRLRQPIGWQPQRDYLPWLDKLENTDQAASPILLTGTRQLLGRHTFISRLMSTARKPLQNRQRLWEDLNILAKLNSHRVATLDDVKRRILESDLRASLAALKSSRPSPRSRTSNR